MDVAVMDRLEDILSSCEYNGEGISSLLNKGCIKSVQRGIKDLIKASSAGTHLIDISTISPEKALIEVTCALNNNSTWPSSCCVESVTDNQITVFVNHGGTINQADMKLSWQVIEFY